MFVVVTTKIGAVYGTFSSEQEAITWAQKKILKGHWWVTNLFPSTQEPYR